jgi:hypothetical protein
MFDLLKTVRGEVATEAVYLAGLRIREREFFPEWRRWLPLRPGNATFPESLRVAAGLLDAIERDAGVPLARLGEADVEPYQRAIRALMDERYRRERRGDPSVARRILAEMRRDYGSPERAVA